MVQGELPPVEVALDLYNILSKSDTDLRLPVGLETQLLKDNDMDSDVAKSMLQLLKVLLGLLVLWMQNLEASERANCE